MKLCFTGQEESRRDENYLTFHICGAHADPILLIKTCLFFLRSQERPFQYPLVFSWKWSRSEKGWVLDQFVLDSQLVSCTLPDTPPEVTSKHNLETSGIQILFFVVRVILVFQWQKRSTCVDRFLGQLLQDLHNRKIKARL